MLDFSSYFIYPTTCVAPRNKEKSIANCCCARIFHYRHSCGKWVWNLRTSSRRCYTLDCQINTGLTVSRGSTAIKDLVADEDKGMLRGRHRGDKLILRADRTSCIVITSSQPYDTQVREKLQVAVAGQANFIGFDHHALGLSRGRQSGLLLQPGACCDHCTKRPPKMAMLGEDHPSIWFIGFAHTCMDAHNT